MRPKTTMGSFDCSVALASGEYAKLLQTTYLKLEEHDFVSELNITSPVDVFSYGTLK